MVHSFTESAAPPPPYPHSMGNLTSIKTLPHQHHYFYPEQNGGEFCDMKHSPHRHPQFHNDPSTSHELSSAPCQPPFQAPGNYNEPKQARRPAAKKPKGKREFLCTVPNCGKKFSRTDELKRHNRIHTGDKPYKCDKCQRSFSRSDHLRTHTRTHTGEKPYECRHCIKAFARSDERKRHEKTHERAKGKLRKQENSKLKSISKINTINYFPPDFTHSFPNTSNPQTSA